MPLSRIAFILLAVYFVFLGGGPYYYQSIVVRFFHHASVTVLLTWWLVRRIRQGNGLPVTPLNLPIFVAVGVWPLSAAFSLDPRMAFENLWFPFTHTMIFFILVSMVQHGKQRLLMETQFILAALVVMLSVVQILSWYFGLGIVPDSEVGWVDVIGPGAWLPLVPVRLHIAMGVSTWVAAYTVPLILLAVGWAQTVHRSDYRKALWGLAVALVIVLLLTFSRGGIVSLAAGGSGWLMMRLAHRSELRERLRERRLRLPLALGVGGALVIVALALFAISQRRVSGDQLRRDLWRSAVEMAIDHPLLGVGSGLYGRGLRSYRDPSQASDRISSAHNVYLNTTAETGLIGLTVSGALGLGVARAWWKQWKGSYSQGRTLRLEAAFAALLGMAAQSLFDVLLTTPLVLLILLLTVYCISDQRLSIDKVSQGQHGPAVFALAGLLAYGVWFVQIDRAQLHHQRSLRGGDEALKEAQVAAQLDPSLRLYQLQVAYLTGQHVLDNPDAELDEAIAVYEEALTVEPTWETGWMNLAALQSQEGDLDAAIAALDKARRLNYRSAAWLHWARLAEESGNVGQEEIIAAYIQGMEGNGSLPLSAFWGETALRREALRQYMAQVRLDWQFRIVAVHWPEMLEPLVPQTPITAEEWWVVGEYALAIHNDPGTATEAFGEAIALAPANGDYYASRARAELTLNPDAARRDLNVAYLLYHRGEDSPGLVLEYPNAITLAMTTSPEEIRELRVKALPARVLAQNFEGVLYGRVSRFDVFPEMRQIGPGRAAMQPWYDLAESFLEEGQQEQAVQVYRAILGYAPDEALAREQLASLGAM